jgi:protein-tyrosine phosphatase
MKIKTVCDFRSDYEVDLAPDQLPDDGSVTYVQLPIIHGDFEALKALETLEKGVLKKAFVTYLMEGYIKSIEDFAPVWGDVIHHLAESKNIPMVFHCTSGKDRTGTCAALILLALGVPEKIVKYDYSLSGFFITRHVEAYSKNIEKLGVDPKRIIPFSATPAKYIEPFLDHLRQAYGSAENYLHNAAGVKKETLIRLKELLLE